MYQIIDNVLSQTDFLNIKNTLLSNQFPWYYGPIINNEELVDPESKEDNFQFTHIFYNNNEFKSGAASLVNPIIDVLNPFSLIRIKANLNIKTESLKKQGFHVDYKNCKTAIYYVNTNNGKTIFEDGQHVDSIENRMVIFNSNILHTGTSCTDQNVRCLINFNFIDWRNHE